LISIFVDDDEGPALTNARSRPGMAGGGRLIRGSAGDLLFFLLAEMTQAVIVAAKSDVAQFYEFLCWSNWCKHAGSKEHILEKKFRITVSTEAGELELLYPPQPHVHNENS
jgi:hypothetical protein